MADESAGASPQRGFYFQNLAAAHRLIVEDAENLPRRPTEVRIEQNDSDFMFNTHTDDHIHYHYYESKFKESGEIKWSKFKNSIFPEFYKIYKKHLPSGKTNIGNYHVITNQTFASGATSIIDIKEICEDIRSRKRWGTIKTEYGRKEFRKLINGVQNSDKLDGEGIDLPEEPEDIHLVLAGLYFESHSKDKLELELQEYLQDVAPTDFRRAKSYICDEVCSSPGELIRREDIENELGLTFRKPGKTAGNQAEDIDQLRREAEKEVERMSQGTSEEIKRVESQDKLEKYADSLTEEAGERVANHIGDAISEDYEELIQKEAELASAEQDTIEHIRQIQELDPGYNMEEDDE